MKQSKDTPLSLQDCQETHETLSPSISKTNAIDQSKESNVREPAGVSDPKTGGKTSGSAGIVEASLNLMCNEQMDIPIAKPSFLSQNQEVQTPVRNDQIPSGLRDGNEVTILRKGSTSSIHHASGVSPHLQPTAS